jgi:cell wall assembly regulator SMI1
MQKFTRELTREVEVNGERVALTLSEKGVSLRPVGSRKPPLEITWADVIKAAGPAAAPEKETPATGLSAALARLDAWLKAHRPAFFATLQKGAADADLQKLAKQLGRPVPEELATWLRWHDGQDADVPAALVGAFTLIDHEEVADAYRDRTAGMDGPWNAGWFPLLDDFNDSLICLDTTRPGVPVIEVWRGRESAIDASPSLEAWVQTLLSDFEAGKYAEDAERGHYHKKS